MSAHTLGRASVRELLFQMTLRLRWPGLSERRLRLRVRAVTDSLRTLISVTGHLMLVRKNKNTVQYRALNIRDTYQIDLYADEFIQSICATRAIVTGVAIVVVCEVLPSCRPSTNCTARISLGKTAARRGVAWKMGFESAARQPSKPLAALPHHPTNLTTTTNGIITIQHGRRTAQTLSLRSGRA